LKNHYGFDISKGKLTEITDRILPKIDKWKNRTLEPIYSFVWMDALHYSVREHGVTKKKAVYVVLGYDMHGKKDVLGLYIGEAESAKFWSTVLEDIQNRGVNDILIACTDNLSGFTAAIESIFPLTNVQLCVIHQIRNSMKYVSHKNSASVLEGLKCIYKAHNLSAAEIAMDKFEEQWDEKYPLVVKSWRKNWLNLTTFFDYSKDIRRIMYTTNIIEGFNRQLRKYTKTRGAFNGDNALMKLLFTATMNISSDWTAKPANWGLVQQQLIIKYEERCGIRI
jgi:putative transposase